ncbi:MAG: MBG domain-containing protein, partial [bacterium]
RYAQYSSSKLLVINPTGPSSYGVARVIRGGSWGGCGADPFVLGNAGYSQVAYRNNTAHDGPSDTIGFRCVKAAPSDGGTTPVVSAPFNADFRDFTLTVASARGTPAPSVGSMNYAWHATVTGTVQSVVSAGGTNWTCVGWTGAGTSPVSGSTTNTGPVMLTNLTSSITWQWSVSAFKPSISVQPQSRTNTYNTTAVVSVVATGMPAVVYQWRRNGTNLVNGSRITGAMSNTLTLANTQMADAGGYTVVVSNSMGSVTSQVAALTMKKAVASVVLGGLTHTYNCASKAASASTTPSGLTVNLTYNGSTNCPVNAGSYTVVGTINDLNYTGSATGTLTVVKASQTIAFNALPQVTADASAVPLNAASSSGLPITFQSENQSVAVVANDVAMIAGAGSTTIAAMQLGNENYEAAPTENQTLLVTRTGFGLWAYANGLTGEEDAMFSQDRNSDGIPNGFEYAFGTNFEPGNPILNIRMVNGHPIVEIPQQDTATLSYVDVQVKGCTNLLCGPDGWSLPVTSETNAPGKPANRAWFKATSAPANAYFKLEASLK